MKRLCILVVLFLSVQFVDAQVGEIKNCGTVEQDQINRLKYPQMGKQEDFENAIQSKISELHARRAAGRTLETTITIPVVVHVVHTGEAVGTGLNISQAQVQAQLDVLNEDFRRKAGTPGFNSDPRGADIGIEFCLSPFDQNGNAMAEPGIHRVRRTNTTWTKTEIEGQLKPQTIWNPNLFFNIWTVKFGGADASLLGYAQFPDQSGLGGLNQIGGPGSTDGVVVQYSSFGSVLKGTFPSMAPYPYNKGRTLTHETGHWLGLRHIWGDGPCASDFVSDTPTHHAENRNCSDTKLSCDGVNFEMVRNYMDYTNDECMNIFTQGQKDRIMAVLELSPRRKQLVEANLCNSVVTQKPVANFNSNKQLTLRDGEVVFTDLSANFPKEWNWTFEGGDPGTSTAQNPKVKYYTPGTYKVILIAKNTIGIDTVEVDDFITVSEDGLCNDVNNFQDTYTPSILPLHSDGEDGYLTGHNSERIKAVSELFDNPQGYAYISGVKIRFGKVYAASEDATAVITVWNARGIQNGPGTVVEQKEVLLKQIIDDVANNRATEITFDRQTPAFSRPYHIGVELNYGTPVSDTLAIVSSANGEANNSTSWVLPANSIWQTYSTNYGVNIAMDIQPIVGMNPSVQVSASKLLINPGEEVILNARGASIFVWDSSDNTIVDIPGPQIIVQPLETTTYQTSGSGLELCNNVVETKIYVREGTITGVTEINTTNVTLFPNPGTGSLNIAFENGYRGPVEIGLHSMLNQPIRSLEASKTSERFETKIDATSIPAGVYITSVKMGESTIYGKWIKQ